MFLFDKFCELVEQCPKLDLLIEPLQSATYYYLPITPQHYNLKEFNNINYLIEKTKTLDKFCVIEDNCSCILLLKSFGQKNGIDIKSNFIEFISGIHNIDKFEGTENIDEETKLLFENTNMLIAGNFILEFSTKTEYTAKGLINKIIFIENNKMKSLDLNNFNHSVRELITAKATKNAITGLEEFLNIGNNYNVTKIEKAKLFSEHTIARSYERDYFTIIKM